MKKFEGWTALFSLKHKKGVNFEEALAAIAGDKEPDADADAAFDDATRDRIQDFLMDQDAFMKTNASDKRLPQWTKLTASIQGAPAPAAKKAAAPKAAAPKPAPAAKKPPAPVQPAPPLAASTAPAPAPPAPAATLVLPTRQSAQPVSANALVAAARAAAPPAPPAFQGFGGRVEPPDDGHGREDRGDRDRGRGRDRGNRGEDDARKQQDETARLAKEEEVRRAAFVRAHTPPAEHVALLHLPLYVLCRESYSEVCVKARSSDSAIRAQGEAQLKTSLTLLHGWRDGKSGPEKAAIARHILRLIDELANRRDLTDPTWFICNFVTGKWEDAPT